MCALQPRSALLWHHPIEMFYVCIFHTRVKQIVRTRYQFCLGKLFSTKTLNSRVIDQYKFYSKQIALLYILIIPFFSLNKIMHQLAVDRLYSIWYKRPVYINCAFVRKINIHNSLCSWCYMCVCVSIVLLNAKLWC